MLNLLIKKRAAKRDYINSELLNVNTDPGIRQNLTISMEAKYPGALMLFYQKNNLRHPFRTVFFLPGTGNILFYNRRFFLK